MTVLRSRLLDLENRRGECAKYAAHRKDQVRHRANAAKKSALTIFPRTASRNHRIEAQHSTIWRILLMATLTRSLSR